MGCDCTLVCYDGQISAHKVILAACSSFFSSVFSNQQQQHYYIYLRGMKTSQVMILLNYIYQGVTQIEQEELKDFLLICEDLQVQGLIQKSDDRGSDNCGVETVQLEKDGNSETITLTQEDK